MTDKPDLDSILRDLREATKKAEEALAKRSEPEEPEPTNVERFAEHLDGLFGRTSLELTESFVKDYPTTDTTEENNS